MSEPPSPSFLSSLFIPHLRPAARDMLEQPDLETSLAELLATARAAWPELPLPDALFLRHLAERLPEGNSPVHTLGVLHAGDLYLACACAEGVPAAYAVLESRLLPEVDTAVARVVGSAEGVAEVRRHLRGWLLTSEEGRPPRIADYQGSGPLVAWLRAAAVRTALSLQREARRRTHAEEEALADGAGGGTDTERD